MKLLILLPLICLLSVCHVYAQSTSWFYGSWTGITYFPNGPITKRIINRLQVTKVSGNSFTATLANLYPNDSTVRLQRLIAGKIENKDLIITSNVQTYIRDPRTQNFWFDCTSCPTQSSFSITSSIVEIKITTINCGDVCNGETVFTRDTSDFTPLQKIQLAQWFGFPINKAIVKSSQKTKDSSVAVAAKPMSNPLKTDTNVMKKDTLAIVAKPFKKDTVQMAAPAKKDTLSSELTNRATNLINTYQVTSPKITIQLFDNAEVDGDIVSVFHNGKLITDHQMLTHKAITFTVTASPQDRHHEFVLVAENLGLIPPNTALMRITAGKQMFEIEVSSDLSNNAKIAIDYTGE